MSEEAVGIAVPTMNRNLEPGNSSDSDTSETLHSVESSTVDDVHPEMRFKEFGASLATLRTASTPFTSHEAPRDLDITAVPKAKDASLFGAAPEDAFAAEVLSMMFISPLSSHLKNTSVAVSSPKRFRKDSAPSSPSKRRRLASGDWWRMADVSACSQIIALCSGGVDIDAESIRDKLSIPIDCVVGILDVLEELGIVKLEDDVPFWDERIKVQLCDNLTQFDPSSATSVDSILTTAGLHGGEGAVSQLLGLILEDAETPLQCDTVEGILGRGSEAHIAANVLEAMGLLKCERGCYVWTAHKRKATNGRRPARTSSRASEEYVSSSMATSPSTKHRASCHRCGNMRKKVINCRSCPQIYCRVCADMMEEEHGAGIFEGGCPRCKELCCCGKNKDSSCPKTYHCYRKCPATKPTSRGSRGSKNRGSPAAMLRNRTGSISSVASSLASEGDGIYTPPCAASPALRAHTAPECTTGADAGTSMELMED